MLSMLFLPFEIECTSLKKVKIPYHRGGSLVNTGRGSIILMLYFSLVSVITMHRTFSSKVQALLPLPSGSVMTHTNLLFPCHADLVDGKMAPLLTSSMQRL